MARLPIILFVTGSLLAAASPAAAAGGCGWGWHRGFLGACVRNEGPVAPAATVVAPAGTVVAPAGTEVIVAPAGRPCPVGYHLGPQGRRCWPN